MEQRTNRIVNLRPPTSGTVPGIGVTRLATSTTAASVDLTASGSMFGKHLRLYNEDATNSVWVSFGVAASPPLSSATAGAATLAAGTVAANGFRIPPASSIDVRLTKPLHPYLYTQASAGTPVLCIFPVTPGVAGT